MGLWELSNKLESLSYKIKSLQGIVDMTAERILSETESSALWACSDMLELHSNSLEELSNEVMEMHREKGNEERAITLSKILEKTKKAKK